MIHGDLFAHGTTANPITFDRSGSTGSWGGIRITPSGNANISYCQIKNASLGLEADNTGNLNIINSKLIDCATGIAAGGLSSIGLYGTQITGYVFTGSYTDIGASLDALCALITIDDEPWSDCSQVAIRNFGGDVYFELGELRDNGQALYNEFGSWANLGDEEFCSGLNNIICNLIDINTNEDILAQNNYWGGAEPDNFDGYGAVDYDPWLDEVDQANPFDGDCESSLLAKTVSVSESSNFSEFTSEDYKLYKQGLKRFREKDYESAVTDFESILSQYPTSFFARFALQKWLLIKFDSDSEDDVLPYLSLLKDKMCATLTDYVNQMEILTYRKIDQPQTALTLIDKYQDESKSNLYNSFFMYQKGLIYKNDLKDSDQAELLFNAYLQQYPDDGRTQMVLTQLSMISGATPPIVKQPGYESETDVVPSEFQLYAAYPNPFNPSTTFRYASPWSGDLKVEIFNALGQRVRVFDKIPFPEGYNELVWNGQNEAGRLATSGLYIVRFTATSSHNRSLHFEGISKVLFLK